MRAEQSTRVCLNFWVYPQLIVYSSENDQLFRRVPIAGFGHLEHVGEPATAPAIAPARSPPQEMKIAQQLAAPGAFCAAIPELEFNQTQT